MSPVIPVIPAGLVALLALLALLLGSLPAHAAALRVIAGTSLIADITRDLSGGDSTILTLAQASGCPGHDNAKTRDFVFAAQADLVLIHAFQEHLPQVVDMLQAVGTGRERLRVVEAPGSWLVPDNQIRAVHALAALLTAAAPDQAAAIAHRAQQRIAKVHALARQCAASLAPLRGKAVVCARMQAEFVAWAGFTVLQSYGRAEELSAKELTGLVQNMRGRQIYAVVDNEQSGPNAGLPLAQEWGVPHLSLSNFPGSDASVPDYFSLLRANVARLLQKS